MAVQDPRKIVLSRLPKEIRKELVRLGAPIRAVSAFEIEAMKPGVRDQPFTKKEWIFELKYDGFRLLAEKMEESGAQLAYRSGRDASRIFPEIASALIDVPFRSIVVDGEAVIFDETGRPDFQRLQRRVQRTRAIDVKRAAAEHPAVLCVFDLLMFEGFDLRPLPLSARKAILRRLLPQDGLLRYVDDVAERGEDFYAAVAAMGLEGIVAKRADSPYRGGYSNHWLKIRVDRTADFAIVGYEPGPGGLRCLHLALCEGGELTYAGTVGSGLDSRELAEIRKRLEPARRSGSAMAGSAAGRGIVWVEPEVVCEVRYKQWTRDGRLRQPVFLRLREDKRVEECSRPVPIPE
jgi:bifunctional non-homologous end joining protein LigD